ncbi:MAG TPA: cob(I)yrinic acid a,c-diamide adenosyltransferase [Methylophilaceae bacterium]
MGNRLSKIYTRTGDDGSTGLGDGSRTAKNSPRVEAMGDVDELNSILGVLMVETMPESIHKILIAIQHDLFDLGGELCIPGYVLLKSDRTDWLEQRLDEMNEHLSPLKEFILPGGTRAAALTHQARTVCRRAERRIVTMRESESVAPAVAQYINRLSDFLFVLARTFNRLTGEPDVLWNRQPAP